MTSLYLGISLGVIGRGSDVMDLQGVSYKTDGVVNKFRAVIRYQNGRGRMSGYNFVYKERCNRSCALIRGSLSFDVVGKSVNGGYDVTVPRGASWEGPT